MPFPELEKYKRQSPRLADLLSQLEVYLDEVLNRPIPHAGDFDHAALDIVPILVAKGLRIDENLAITLLQMAEEAGIIVHRYHIYCPNTENFISAFDSKEALPDNIECPFELRTEHSIDEYFVEVVFNFSPKVIHSKLAISM